MSEDKEMERWKEDIEDTIDELRKEINTLNGRVETLGTAFSAIFNIILRVRPIESDKALKELIKIGEDIRELEERIERLEEKLSAVLSLVAGIEHTLKQFRLSVG